MTNYLSRRWFMIVGAACAFAATPGLAAEHILSATQAAEKLARGEIVLLDIRSRAEWKETGLAEGALPVSLHERGFGEKLQTILKAYDTDKIAVICATGGRTAHVVDLLSRNGITGVWDVSEGMMGNNRGPGWIERGMPVVNLDAAEERLAETGLFDAD